MISIVKPYNPNTKYGRKKLREQAVERYSKLSIEEKSEWDSTGCIFILIVAGIICAILYGAGGKATVLQWLRR